MPKAIYL